MAELADALDLGSSAARRAGSNPVPGTRTYFAQKPPPAANPVTTAGVKFFKSFNRYFPIATSQALLVDVLFGLQTFNESLYLRLGIVRSYVESKLGVFEGAFEVSVSGSNTRLFHARNPMSGVLFDVGAEDLKSLLLLSLAYQLEPLAVELE